MLFDVRYLRPALLAAASCVFTTLAAANDVKPRTAGVTPPDVVTPGPAAPVGTAPRLDCIRDWSEAGPIVRREGLATIERVSRLARDRAAGDVVTSALCRADERYIYRLTVRTPQGALRSVIVDARQPFGQ